MINDLKHHVFFCEEFPQYFCPFSELSFWYWFIGVHFICFKHMFICRLIYPSPYSPHTFFPNLFLAFYFISSLHGEKKFLILMKANLTFLLFQCFLLSSLRNFYQSIVISRIFIWIVFLLYLGLWANLESSCVTMWCEVGSEIYCCCCSCFSIYLLILSCSSKIW